MKHLGFTIQFVLLLVSIPLLMFVELTRDQKEKTKEETGSEKEVVFTKKSPVSMDGSLLDAGKIKNGIAAFGFIF